MTEETANTIVAGFANTVGAAESVLRVAATGHDKRLFFKVVISLIFFSAIGRIAPGHTVAYTGNHSFFFFFFFIPANTILTVLFFAQGYGSSVFTSSSGALDQFAPFLPGYSEHQMAIVKNKTRPCNILVFFSTFPFGFHYIAYIGFLVSPSSNLLV